MSVIDAAALMEVDDADPAAFAVVLEDERGPVALAVEAVEGFRTIYADELVDGLDGTTRPVLAATPDRVCVLDVPRVLASEGVVAQR